MEPNFSRRVPDGDTHARLVCDRCDFVAYENPKIVVGAVCEYEGQILLCQRDIEPRRGYWTLPAGYLELGETPEEGAIREVREEACADVTLDCLLGCYAIPRISQVLLIYRAKLQTPQFAAGDETRAVELTSFESIPWDKLAFPTVLRALRDWATVRGEAVFTPFATPAEEPRTVLPVSGPLPDSAVDGEVSL